MIDCNLSLKKHNFGETQQQQLHYIVQNMAEFIALYEAASDKITAKENALHARFTEYETRITEYIAQVQNSVQHLEQVMTQAGVSRWKLAAENALKEGKTHAKTIEKATESFRQLTNDTCERLDRATAYTIRGVSDAVSSFRVADFKLMADECCEQVEHVAITASKNISKITRWSYWRKLTMVFVFSIIVSMLTGLYLTDELPWELHKDIVLERQVGAATIEAWPKLSKADQKMISNLEARHMV